MFRMTEYVMVEAHNPTDYYTALANTSHPKFIRMAGAARMINVGAIGNTVTMNVTMNIMTIITANVAAVLALVSF